jgi:hypothetical protein
MKVLVFGPALKRALITMLETGITGAFMEVLFIEFLFKMNFMGGKTTSASPVLKVFTGTFLSNLVFRRRMLPFPTPVPKFSATFFTVVHEE